MTIRLSLIAVALSLATAGCSERCILVSAIRADGAIVAARTGSGRWNVIGSIEEQLWQNPGVLSLRTGVAAWHPPGSDVVKIRAVNAQSTRVISIGAPVLALQFSRRAQRLAVATRDQLLVYDVITGGRDMGVPLARELPVEYPSSFVLDWSADDRTILVSSPGSRIPGQLVDTETRASSVLCEGNMIWASPEAVWILRNGVARKFRIRDSELLQVPGAITRCKALWTSLPATGELFLDRADSIGIPVPQSRPTLVDAHGRSQAFELASISAVFAMAREEEAVPWVRAAIAR